MKQKPVLDKIGIQITGIVSQCVDRFSLKREANPFVCFFTFQVKENIPEEIKSFREDVWSEPLFMDEKLEFYTAVGGGKKNQYSTAGFLASLANPFSKLYKNVITKGKKYKQKTNLVGEGLITGGLYVVHAGGKPEYSFLEKNMPDSLPSGIIHADLFPDNIFFEGKELSGIIDFYFSCNDFYAYEIAICVNAWCFEPSNNEFNPTKARLLLKNYNNIREFSIEEIEALPMLTRASALRYLLTRLIDYFSHDDNDLILKKDPAEYLTKLKFHQTVKRPSEYGL